jgi:hypothetical protein
MGWAYLTQEEAQRTIEPNTLTVWKYSRRNRGLCWGSWYLLLREDLMSNPCYLISRYLIRLVLGTSG